MHLYYYLVFMHQDVAVKYLKLTGNVANFYNTCNEKNGMCHMLVVVAQMEKMLICLKIDCNFNCNFGDLKNNVTTAQLHVTWQELKNQEVRKKRQE